jgi:hypothetical protein
MIKKISFALLMSSGVCFLGGQGNRLAPEAKPIGVLQMKNSKSIESSPWGIQIGSLEEDMLAKAAAIGVKWTRLHAKWEEIEKDKNTYDWTATDKAFSASLENGITPFVCLDGSNPLYCKESEVDAREKEIYGISLQPPTKDEKAMEHWLKFVTAIVERYKGKILYWEVWNEPNHRHYWGAEPNGVEYGKLVKATSSIIKSIDPAAKVIAGALAGLDPEFTDKFLSNGTAKGVDIITFHNYGEIPEERIYKALDTWKVIEKYRVPIQLWQGECGYPSHSSTSNFRGTGPWGLQIQAKWLLRQSFTDIYFCRASMSNYFKLVHLGGRGEIPVRSFLTSTDSVLGFPSRNGARVKSVGVNEKSLLDNPQLNPKSAYYAYQNLCSFFDGKYKPMNATHRITIKDAGVFYGIGKEDDAFPSIPLVAPFKSGKNKYMIAYWLPWRMQESVQSATIDLQISDIVFHNPVLIDPLSGTVYTVHQESSEKKMTIFRNIPLSDYPMVLVEREAIEMK